jgi:DNA topoisomerase IB
MTVPDTTAEIVAEAREALEAAGLRYVSDAEPGIRRERVGERFRYRRPGGRVIRDKAEIDRLARLAVPPAYEDVWICADTCGHLQATGRDARGRKQYRYHPAWREARDGAKFVRMIEFAASLPRLRRRLRRDLARPGLPREKVLAVVVSLLDATRVRIGNVEYARDNDSYGLTTLRNRHARFVRDRRLELRFRGKGGAEHQVTVDDARLVRIVRSCHQLPGKRLFQYVDDAGERHPVDSGMVNAYLKDAMGADFTAKDFRTWGATLRAAAILHATPHPEPASKTAMKACVVAAIKQVAADLRNTPAVCRKSYINPVVLSAWEDGKLHAAIKESLAAAPRRAETLVLAFLRRCARGTRAAARKQGATPARVCSPRRRAPRRAPRPHQELPLGA